MVKIFVVLDGIGDRPCKILDNLTPLQYAETPNLDYFASKSKHGFVYSLNEKIAPESDEAILALLGYDPQKYYPGRGPLEAYGAGLEFKEGYLALRVNFATVDAKGRIIDRRVGRSLSSAEAVEFEKAINQGVSLGYPFKFKATIGHRGVLVIKGDFSDNISNVDPAYKKVGKFGVAVPGANDNVHICKPLDPDKKTKLTANIVNEFTKQSHEILNNHKLNKERKRKYLLEANFILSRDSGIRLIELPKKNNWGAVVAMPLEIGISKLSGMNILSFKYPENNNNDLYKNLFLGLNKTIEESIKAIKENKYNNYFIHFKETDIPGHDNKPKEKVGMIEIIDAKFFKFLRSLKDVELVVTGDHSTPCELKGHSNDAVPLMHFSNEEGDVIDRFNEVECLEGSYGKMYGKEVLKKVGFE